MDTMRICSYLWMVLVVVWLVAWFKAKRSQERMNFGSRLLYGIPVFIGCYLLFSDGFSGWLQERIFPKNIWIEALAVALTAAGIAFAIWARFYIGENWSSAVSIKVDHQLIRTGPYAWVRHPIYSGILLGMIGSALARREPRGFVAILFLMSWILDQAQNGRGIHAQDFWRTISGLQPIDWRADSEIAIVVTI